jgi:hypothetical protein
MSFNRTNTAHLCFAEQNTGISGGQERGGRKANYGAYQSHFRNNPENSFKNAKQILALPETL